MPVCQPCIYKKKKGKKFRKKTINWNDGKSKNCYFNTKLSGFM